LGPSVDGPTYLSGSERSLLGVGGLLLVDRAREVDVQLGPNALIPKREHLEVFGLAARITMGPSAGLPRRSEDDVRVGRDVRVLVARTVIRLLVLNKYRLAAVWAAGRADHLWRLGVHS
jgi:hypothetical protein